jgi:hypothetical protein
MSIRKISTATLQNNQPKYNNMLINDWADFSNVETGTYTQSGFQYKYISFTSNGTLTITRPGFADILLVSGGGGGSFTTDRGTKNTGGGGGNVVTLGYIPAGSYAISIGGGGAAGSRGGTSAIGDLLKHGGGNQGVVGRSTGNIGASGSALPGGVVTGGEVSANPVSGTGLGGGSGGGIIAGANSYSGRVFDWTNTSVEYGMGGYTGGTPPANTGNGGFNVAGASGIVVVRVRI